MLVAAPLQVVLVQLRLLLIEAVVVAVAET